MDVIKVSVNDQVYGIPLNYNDFENDDARINAVYNHMKENGLVPNTIFDISLLNDRNEKTTSKKFMHTSRGR